MRGFVRRAIVASALGTGLIYAGFVGLSHASAATGPNIPSPSQTATSF